MAPGPPDAPPGALTLGADTKRSPLGANTSARGSWTMAYRRRQKSGGTAPATLLPPSVQKGAPIGAFGPLSNGITSYASTSGIEELGQPAAPAATNASMGRVSVGLISQGSELRR